MKFRLLIVMIVIIVLFASCAKKKSPLAAEGIDPNYTATVVDTLMPDNTMSETITSSTTPTYTSTFTNTSTNTQIYTPTQTFTHSSTPENTSVYTNTLTNTQTGTSTYTSTYTSTVTFTETFTETFTQTPTSTTTPFTASCFIPKIQPYEYDMTFNAGVTITARVYTYFADIDVRVVIKDDADTVLCDSWVKTDSSGYFYYKYLISGTEQEGNWKFELYDSVGKVDGSNGIVLSVFPTVTATPPCADMPAISANQNYTMQRYQFKLDGCEVVYYANRWSSIQEAIIAIFDGGNNLVHSHTVTNGYMYTAYQLNGAEIPGYWKVLLYNLNDPPPMIYDNTYYGLQGCMGLTSMGFYVQ